jgi:acyl transferase domain-containing protein/NAD(P)H-dependent flavin oxidoreductase YrpB (nitropropane dioxygenase family)/NAD(P)-dependent dehydrogenase (short-subunit alcohol dehydrogenase family)
MKFDPGTHRTRPDNFSCLVLIPVALREIGSALGVARAGGIAILDGEMLSVERFADLWELLRSLDESAPPSADIGIRISAAQAELILLASEHPQTRRSLTLVLSEKARASGFALVAQLKARGFQRVLLEVSTVNELQEVKEDDGYDGLITRGSECGGWVGETGSFILLQQVLKLTRLAVYARGGIGFHGAAACRLAGAAGVVLDDQLLLMSDSPVPQRWRKLLARLSAQDSVVLGSEFGGIRVLLRQDFPQSLSLERSAMEIERSGADAEERHRMWREIISRCPMWGDPRETVWPIGQAVLLASAQRDQYGTTSKLVHAILRETENQIRKAARQRCFNAGSSLAASLGTTYPLIQGPMTRVSDEPQFALKIAEEGALPMLALANLSPEQIARLVRETHELLGEHSWGVGLLGYLSEEVLRPQMTEVTRHRPRFAVVAGGRPDQAAYLESAGIRTYLHTPAPSLLLAYLKQGARRFIFEGRECGGHVGPLGSFLLWESAILALVSSDEVCSEVEAIFAGGIHDALSAAMLAVMIVPLVDRRVRVGLLMGTAYLFTREAVETGAITSGYQAQAIACEQTVLLPTGTGHANRCAQTPFASEFKSTRQELLKSGTSPEQIRDALEHLTLGRLRLATKGLYRMLGRKLTTASLEDQRERGMYMLGDVATLRERVHSVRDLHCAVCEQSSKYISDVLTSMKSSDARQQAQTVEVAIIGIATILPGASDLASFWRNVLNNRCQITEVPPERWELARYFNADQSAQDTTYSRWGGFLPDLYFEPIKYGIPPKYLGSISATQIIALELAGRAFADAGYAELDFDREKTAVILAGNNRGDMLFDLLVTRSMLPMICESKEQRQGLAARLPAWTEQSFPGILDNIIAGRIANRFDLKGPSFVVDSACASSLTAIDLAIREIQSGRSNLVLTGGIDIGIDPYQYLAFSMTKALSPNGEICVFDERANGTVLGEGAAMLVLKRLSDAERDGNRIYAVLKGSGGSSDGKALGITAPLPDGQMRALKRAYEDAGIPPHSVRMYEAHATGTGLGDKAELQSLRAVLEEDGATSRSCFIGSVKSLIGHTRNAAGATSLIKASLSLYHQVLPPQSGIDQPLPLLRDPASPLTIVEQPQPWLAATGVPRRAGVSAFGFGGANTHVVLEEYNRGSGPRPIGAERWPTELFLFAGESEEDVRQQIRRLSTVVDELAPSSFTSLAYTCALAVEAAASKRVVVGLAAEDAHALSDLLKQTDKHLAGERARPNRVVIERRERPESLKVAFLYSGQGSQYVGMFRDAVLYLPELRESLEAADSILKESYAQPLSDYIFPAAAMKWDDQDKVEAALRDTHIVQPALGALSAGITRLLARVGLISDMFAGHSYGELVALYGAGGMDYESLIRLSEARGRAMAEAVNDSRSGMFAVQLARAELEREVTDGIVISNHNAPAQTVISGANETLSHLCARLKERGIPVRALPVAGAFHSPLMRRASELLSPFVRNLKLRKPRSIYLNRTGARFEGTLEDFKREMLQSLFEPVEFVKQIRGMYAAGARLFVEIGPGHILSSFVSDILAGLEHTVVSTGSDHNNLAGLLLELARLIPYVKNVRLSALFDGRDVEPIALDAIAPRWLKERLSDVCWIVRGGQLVSPGHAPLSQSESASSDLRPFLDKPAAASTHQPSNGSGSSDKSSLESNVVAAYIAYQETMRQFLKSQQETVHEFLATVANGTSLPSLRPKNESPVRHEDDSEQDTSALYLPDPVAEKPELESNVLSPHRSPREILFHAVEEQTGYDTTTLRGEMSIEADLGIDSIRWLEIMEQFLSGVPDSLASYLRGHTAQIIRPGTFSVVIDLIDKFATETALKQKQEISRADTRFPGTHKVEEKAGRAAGNEIDSCPRYIMKAKASMLPSEARPLRAINYLICGDNEVALCLKQLLARDGLSACVIPDEILGSVPAMTKAIEEFRSSAGPICGIVHLAPLSEAEMPASLSGWRELSRTRCRSLFDALKLCAPDMSSVNPAIVICASQLGGSFGRNGKRGNGVPADGGPTGLLKALAREWPGLTIRSIDFEPTLTAAAKSSHLVNEIKFVSTAVDEVGYLNGQRVEFCPVPAPLSEDSSADVSLPADAVVLAIGGGRGITAELSLAIAKPGMRYIILGKTQHPEAGSENSLHPVTNDKQRRIHSEIGSNLKRLKEHCSSVEYHAVNVTDEEAFSQILRKIYRLYGRIDVVMNGAGIVRDQLLINKSPEDFEHVFQTKADSLFLLSQYLHSESLKFLILFGSIAGRFGNAGQTDYAAGNEVVNRFAWRMQSEWPHVKVKALNWGPWGETGMASRLVRDRLTAQGIVPIETNAGCRSFQRELCHGANDVEVIFGDGPWKMEAARRLKA